ncbi:hypothetical protein [Brumimicrobium oceani]|uniref:Uncharacterized protein n=1 Tax=Brumimicrobium oceani TaxID=2100725 RepID=A0A2U2XBN1_9FLAO|nr:hypothetical protein [Brumimicrobium oceani]PWH85160.1 hypothetical protein DIT68_11020 [Brumimicrobium oceani]
MVNQLFTFLFVLTTITSIAQDSLKLQTVDQFGEAVFLSFQSSDLEMFESLLMTDSKFEFILKKIDASDSLKQIFRAQSKGAVLHLSSHSKENFNDILSSADKINFDWGKAQIDEIIEESKVKNGIEQSDITIRIKSGGDSYEMFLRACLKSDTWCVANKVRLLKL